MSDQQVQLRQRRRAAPDPVAHVRAQVRDYVDEILAEDKQLGSTDGALDKQLKGRFTLAEDLSSDPGIRSRQLHETQGPHAAKEYILRTLHRLLMRKTPIDHVARIFNVETGTVYTWRKELRRLVSEEAGRINLNQYIAESKLFYEEIMSMALFECNRAGITTNQKANMMRVASYAQTCQDKLILGFGVAEKKPFTPEDTGKEKDQMSDIFEAVQNSINGVFELTTEQDSPLRDHISILG